MQRIFMPVVEGKAVGEDEYDDLSEDVKIKLRKILKNGAGKSRLHYA